MIRSNWLPAIACILALAGPAYAQAQGDGQQRDDQKQNAKPGQPNSGPSEAVNRGATVKSEGADQALAKPKIYQPNCRKPEDHDQADLCAQWRMAEAAENTLQLTLAQTVIGALGVFFVLVTLFFTARANRAAAIAAQAAVDAIGTERAWLVADRVDLSMPEVVDTPFGAVLVIEAAIKFKNVGRSPATNVVIVGAYRDALMEQPVERFDVPLSEAVNKLVVGAQGEIGTMKFNYNVELDPFRARDTKLIAWSNVSYRSPYHGEISFVTEATFEIRWSGAVGDDPLNTRNYVITSAGSQNTTT